MELSSNHLGLSHDRLLKVFEENNIGDVPITLWHMRHRFKGHGHREIEAEFIAGYMNSKSLVLTRITTDMTLTDAWGDEESTVPGAWWESQEDLLAHALSYVIGTDANKEELLDFIENL